MSKIHFYSTKLQKKYVGTWLYARTPCHRLWSAVQTSDDWRDVTCKRCRAKMETQGKEKS